MVVKLVQLSTIFQILSALSQNPTRRQKSLGVWKSIMPSAG